MAILTGRRLRLACCLCGLLVAAAALGALRPEQAAEYNLKAVFLFNFTKFVEWPADAFPDEKSPLELCILGENLIGPSLDAVVANETWNGRPIAVRRLARGADPQGCHMLFLDRAEREHQAEILAGLRGSNVLSIGETDRFLKDGGLIRFFLEVKRVRFEVNLPAVEKTPIKISSKLLRLAKLMPEERP
jgi:hypothetical protein